MAVDLKAQRIDGLRELISAEPAGRELLRGFGPTALTKQLEQIDRTSPAAITLTPDEIAAAQQLSAMFEGVFLVAAADGEVSQPEVDGLAELLRELADGKITDADVAAMMDQCHESLERDGFSARVQQVAARLDDAGARRAAFVLAVGVAHIDGRVDAAERDVFSALAGALGIAAAESQDLLHQVELELARTLR